MTELTVLASARRDRLNRRARYWPGRRSATTRSRAIIALAAGVVASSTALVSFGLDSAIEVSSALAVAWQFAAPQPRPSGSGARCG